jgi:DNA repair exonuclease SbcCD ATPase subunit
MAERTGTNQKQRKKMNVKFSEEIAEAMKSTALAGAKLGRIASELAQEEERIRRREDRLNKQFDRLADVPKYIDGRIDYLRKELQDPEATDLERAKLRGWIDAYEEIRNKIGVMGI